MTVSLDIAKKLKEAGWEKETEKVWYYDTYGRDSVDGWNLLELQENWLEEFHEKGGKGLFPAPTAGELLRELPAFVEEPKFAQLSLLLEEGDWIASYQTIEVENEDLFDVAADTPEVALGKLWIAIKK